MTSASQRPGQSTISRALFVGTFVGLELWNASIVSSRLGIGITEVDAVLMLLGKLFVDLAILMTGTELLSRWSRTVSAPCAFSFLYLTLALANLLVFLYGNTLFELGYLRLVSTFSLASYAEPLSIGALFVWCAALFICMDHARMLRNHPPQRLQMTWIALAAVGVTFGFAGSRWHSPDETREAELDYASQLLVTQVVHGISDRLDPFLSPRRNTDDRAGEFAAGAPTTTPEWADLQAVLRRYELPMGPRSFPQLATGPYSRVVVVFVESLSLEFLHCENPRINVQTTPFLCSDPVNRAMFTNLWTSGSPTMKGLSAAFTSHPNASFQVRAGYPHSLLKILTQHGFTCVFMRSASRHYGGSHTALTETGFDEIIGSEDVSEELKPFVYGWGLEDRKLYEQLVDLLHRRRDEKLFVAVFGADTHLLTGRDHRSPEAYPAEPGDYPTSFGHAAELMRSVFRSDHDLARLVTMMNAGGFLGPDTLLLITADHACSPSSVTRWVPGHTRSPLGRIPLVMLSGGSLPPVRRDLLSSQLDIAPTLLHLLGLPIPETWWGDSLFAPHKINPAIGFDRRNLIIRSSKQVLVVPSNRRGRAEHGDLLDLFSGRTATP